MVLPLFGIRLYRVGIVEAPIVKPSETAPVRENRPTIVNIPYYVEPEVLEIGATVNDVLDLEHTPLVVLRVEPMLVCRAPDGAEVLLFANEAEVEDES